MSFLEEFFLGKPLSVARYVLCIYVFTCLLVYYGLISRNIHHPRRWFAPYAVLDEKFEKMYSSAAARLKAGGHCLSHSLSNHCKTNPAQGVDAEWRKSTQAIGQRPSGT